MYRTCSFISFFLFDKGSYILLTLQADIQHLFFFALRPALNKGCYVFRFGMSEKDLKMLYVLSSGS